MEIHRLRLPRLPQCECPAILSLAPIPPLRPSQMPKPRFFSSVTPYDFVWYQNIVAAHGASSKFACGIQDIGRAKTGCWLVNRKYYVMVRVIRRVTVNALTETKDIEVFTILAC